MFFNSHILQLNRRLIIVIIVFYLGFGSNTSVFISMYWIILASGDYAVKTLLTLLLTYIEPLISHGCPDIHVCECIVHRILIQATTLAKKNLKHLGTPLSLCNVEMWWKVTWLQQHCKREGKNERQQNFPKTRSVSLPNSVPAWQFFLCFIHFFARPTHLPQWLNSFLPVAPCSYRLGLTLPYIVGTIGIAYSLS